MKKVFLSTSGLALLCLFSFAGCKATVSGGDVAMPDLPTVPAAQANPHPIPSTCVDLTGRYQMNTDLFNLKQRGCEELTWNTEQTYYNPASTYIYRADGKERVVSDDGKSKVYETAYYSDAGFTSERKTLSGGKTSISKKVYYFTNKPCNLMNPDGSQYLTQETFVDGALKSSSCVFWKQIKQ